jgi:predicted enzyme related to lactoylglutathione lyase
MGILQDPIEDLPATWASYIRVEDMSVLDKVEELGGQILLPVADRDIGGQVALIAGPSGAGVALQTWPTEQE